MSDFLAVGRHFLSPKFCVFCSERDFFNTHACLRQLITPTDHYWWHGLSAAVFGAGATATIRIGRTFFVMEW